MNQILFYERNNNNTGIKGTGRISAIVMIVFAVLMIGKGVLGIVNAPNPADKPAVYTREVEDELEIKVECTKKINKIVYSWNNEDENTLYGQGKTSVVETIEIPTGTNILNIDIVDGNNKTTSFTKQFYKDSAADKTKPQIELEPEGSKLKIIVKDNKELASVSYHWNDEDETVISPSEDSKKLIEEKITILKGQNTLTVIAVDKAGNKETKQQVYKGAKKPSIEEISAQGTDLIIKVKDDENIQKVEISINGNVLSTDADNPGSSLNMQEASLQIPNQLKSGENDITVTVYNVSGLTNTETKKLTI